MTFKRTLMIVCALNSFSCLSAYPTNCCYEMLLSWMYLLCGEPKDEVAPSRDDSYSENNMGLCEFLGSLLPNTFRADNSDSNQSSDRASREGSTVFEAPVYPANARYDPNASPELSDSNSELSGYLDIESPTSDGSNLDSDSTPIPNHNSDNGSADLTSLGIYDEPVFNPNW